MNVGLTEPLDLQARHSTDHRLPPFLSAQFAPLKSIRK
jgi:hypothetical protein